MASRHLQGCSSPPVLIKNRSVDPREQVLNVLIACQWYGSGKPSSQLSIGAWFFPTAFWLLWKRSWVRTHGSDGRRVVDCVGSPSSRVQWIYLNLLTTVWKVVICRPCEIRMVIDHTRTERGKRVTYWLSFPCRVYIDSNHRDSRIWVTACLWQSPRS
jgi:hypothetical protein